MVNENEMLDLILNFANLDDRIRLVLMNGSRVDPAAIHDQFCDFDIVFYVRDIKSFTRDESWIETNFGKILILQKPDDWYSHLYDYESNNPFAFLIQFQEGFRIDLTLVDVENYEKYMNENTREPGKILIQKDELPGVINFLDFSKFNIKMPSEKEFQDTCNEFFWLAPYIAKGLYRKELIYVKSIMENSQYEQLYKMLNWSVLIREDSLVRTGCFSKYLYRYLTPKENEDLINCFPGSDFNDIWEKEIHAINLFTRFALFVGEHYHFQFDKQISQKIINYLFTIKNLD
jgi:aminoglycoside 6-adenylyltransferase